MREQVVCLLNFSITDYTAQGKSRPKNPVDLTNCKDHRAYYVALSRATTANGTIILQDFNTDKITRGMTGFLRQELRELELLDEITRLRTEGLLPRTVTGIYRRQLIRLYLLWRGSAPDPPHFHPTMCEDGKGDSVIPPSIDYAEWVPSGTRPQNKRKRKDEAADLPKRKRNKSVQDQGAQMSAVSRVMLEARPSGLIWDAVDYSCGYDSTFTVLANIWRCNPHVWSGQLDSVSPLMSIFSQLMSRVDQGEIVFEQARNLVRRAMHTAKPADFPYGPRGTTIDRIARILLQEDTYASGQLRCSRCAFVDLEEQSMIEPFLSAAPNSQQTRRFPSGLPVSEWLKSHLSTTTARCPVCFAVGVSTRMSVSCTVRKVPPIILIMVDVGLYLYDKTLSFDCAGRQVTSTLRGIIYSGNAHFTSRYISSAGVVWYHDGMLTGRDCVNEGALDAMSAAQLRTARGRGALTLIYAADTPG
ncbi:hypothetical protein C8F04DRAFT_964254 [Mycena alexandri]|uniref:Uncharacterized protein n=1 Tax=Mycena alexandri TaxID=1745969 RepID=A0AAD6SJX3_9AGAR|nr:hypothetical protein C8F04DRAFT_964254 [Mycena alexandri]